MEIINEYGIGYTASLPAGFSPKQPGIRIPKIEEILPSINTNIETGLQSGSSVETEKSSKGFAPETTSTTPETPNTTPSETEKIIDKEQKELWEREDAIRKETQEREDTAYQRSVSDMRKAGVNPNLQSISGAQAGGGIAGATAKNLARIENEKDRNLQLILQEIQQNWQGSQNDLDRLTNILRSGISTFGK